MGCDELRNAKPSKWNKNMRQFGVAHDIYNPFHERSYFATFFNMSKQLLAPGGLNAEYVCSS